MINPINSNLSLLQSDSGNSQPFIENKGKSFKDILQENYAKVSQLQQEADQITEDFVLGKIDNIHRVTIATEKAQLALNMTLSVQNKVFDAYKEVMRLQI